MAFSWCWHPLSSGVCTLKAGHQGAHGHPKGRQPATPKREPTQTQKRSKPSTSKHLREEVNGVLEPQRYQTYVPPDKDQRRDTVAVFRDNLRKPSTTDQLGREVPGELIPVLTVTDREADRRRGGFAVEVEAPPLLTQLEQLRGGSSAKVEMSSGRRAPSSRPPAGADVADLLVDITTGANAFLHKGLKQLGREKELVRRDSRDGRVAELHLDAEPALRRLVEISTEFTPELRDEVVRAVRSWKNAARLLLSVNAPMSKLKYGCPLCGHPLMVRADVSSDVLCTNPDCVDELGRGTRWPRQRWALLLASATEDVDEERTGTGE